MIRRRYEAVREALPSFEVFYSMKANPSLAVVGLLRSLGAGSELASGGELFLAKEAGYDPMDIVFAGPGKSDREIEEAIVSGIYSLNVESFREIERAAHIAKLVGIPARVAIRINTSRGLGKAGGGSAGPLHERMAGGPSKFGIDEEKLERLAEHVRSRAIQVVGVHVYTASQILHVDEIIANARRTVAAAEHLEQTLGTPIEMIDFGGGFGVPHYADEEVPLDMAGLGAGVEEVFSQFSSRRETRLIVELGRYLVSDCGVYLTRVLELKESRGERFVITDGGINQFLRPVLMKVDHEAAVVSRLGEEASVPARIGGPLCTPIDITARDTRVPESVSIDDLVGIMNAGAYGYTMSIQSFLSHPTPAEVLVLDGSTHLARKRGTYEDALLNQLPFRGEE